MKLNVGGSCSLVRVPEAAGLEQRGSHGTGLEQEILDPGPYRAVRTRDAIIGVIAGAFRNGVEVEMVLHVASNARKIVDDRHACRPQRIRGANPRKLKQAWRSDRAATHDHFAICKQGLRSGSLGDRDPDGAAFLDVDPQRLRIEAHSQVLSRFDRLQERARGGGSPGVPGRKLVVADTVLHCAIEIVVEGDARLLGRAQEREADRQRIDRIRNAQGPAVAVIGVDKALVVFATNEIGQNLAVAPSSAASFAYPSVVILGVAACIKLRVDRGAAADDLGLRVPDDATIEVLLRDRAPAPARHALGHLRETRRHGEKRIPVSAACFQQQDFGGWVGAQAICQNAAGRPSADDDVVVGHRPLPKLVEDRSSQCGLRHEAPERRSSATD